MVRTIVKDIFFLGQKSEPATKSDISVGKDLQDTLEVNRAGCVGMADKYDRNQKESDHCKYRAG